MEEQANVTKPELIVDLAWSLIKMACTQRRHPFHTPTLSTLSERGPEARSVILRHADEENWELRANADYRSPKVNQLKGDPRSSWLFYSFPDHLQVRCYGHTQVHHQDEIADKAWRKSQLLSRRCYLAPIAPSLVINDLRPNLPPELVGREPTEEEAEPGFENFTVLRCRITEMDILSLRYEGNLRVCAKPRNTPVWIAP
jgi:3-hydroxyisobutyrate dehydrogenase